jgi:hypothetical protein
MIARALPLLALGACISEPPRPPCSPARELTEIDVPPPLFSPALSRDRRNLFFSARSPNPGGNAIWRAHRDDPTGKFAHAEFFIDSDTVSDAFDPALSPAGDTLWYVDGSGQSGGALHEVHLDGMQGAGNIVTNDPIAVGVSLLHPTFTDPPTRMYFVEYVGDLDLYTATRADATAAVFDPEVPLDELNTNAQESGATITPDGTTLYFESSGLSNDGRDNIVVATRSGGMFVNPTAIAVQHVDGWDDDLGSVHPDGTTIVFSSGRDGDNMSPTLWIACE